MSDGNMKISLPVSQMPCKVAKDRHTKSDRAFKNRYGVSKEEMHNCNDVDYYDTDYFPSAAEKGYRPPEYDPSTDTKTGATTVVLVGRTPQVCCVAHAQWFKSMAYRAAKLLMNQRKTLNDGESPTMQRKFNAWGWASHIAGITKRNLVNKIYRDNQKAQDQEAANSSAPANGASGHNNVGIDVPAVDEAVHGYTGVNAARDPEFQPNDILRSIIDQFNSNEEQGEKGEPDISGADIRDDGINYDF